MTTITLRKQQLQQQHQHQQQQQQQKQHTTRSPVYGGGGGGGSYYNYAIALCQIALVVLAGSVCGFLVAALQAVTYYSAGGSTGRGGGVDDGDAEHYSTTSTVTTTTSRDGSTSHHGCRLPPKTTKLTIASNDIFFDLVVWDDGDFLTETIKTTGVWEILNIQGLAELGDTELPPMVGPAGGVFWDIGANVGYYSFLFAAAGYTVVAVEPERQNAELFRASMCFNPTLAPRMTLLQTAVSSPENMVVDDSSSSNNNKNHHQPKPKCRVVATAKAKRMKQYLHLIPRLVCDNNNINNSNDTTTTVTGRLPRCRRSPDTICQDVTVTTLDTILKSYPPPQVLKLDVEGHELAVFKGGAKLLSLSSSSLSSNNKAAAGVTTTTTTTTATTTTATSSPLIIQYENRDGRTEAEITTLLESHGYTIGTQRGHDSNTVASKIH